MIENGITMVLDKGLGFNAIDDLLLHKKYFNIVKLGWGTALLYDLEVLRSKIVQYQNAGIEVCTGGTLFEYALLNDAVSEIYDYVRSLAIRSVEISNGSIHIPTKRKHEMIEKFIEAEFNVYSEIGCKKSDYDWRRNMKYLIDEAKSDLDAGAEKVIVEARESGNSGIYTQKGELAPFMDMLVDEVGIDQLMFEAPQKKQQVHLIKKFRASVNIGNVKPEDVLSLASLRRGLRSDTLGFNSQPATTVSGSENTYFKDAEISEIHSVREGST